MSRLSLARAPHGRKTRRAVVLLTLVVFAAFLLLSVAGAALAADVDNTTGNPNVTTSAGLEAPKLDYKFVWWTFILTFGLLVVYYLVILRISETEFKKIVDAHFGPKQDGR
jgi:hypothetical protein